MSSSAPLEDPEIQTARDALAIWRAWAPAHEDEFQSLRATLPAATREPSFALARAILMASRHNGAPSKAPPAAALDDSRETRQAAMFAKWAHQKIWAPGNALALRDSFWAWTPETIALREEAFEAPSKDAPRLALAMTRMPDAPWRRWACASAHPESLLEELDQLAFQEPPIANLGAASLHALMGFSGHPAHEWISILAKASSAAGFCAESGGSERFNFLHDFAKMMPSPLPNLPLRPGCGADYSRSLDAMDAAASTPAEELLMSCAGIAWHYKRPSSFEELAASRSEPMLRSLMSAQLGGFPKDFDRRWPLANALRLTRDQGMDPMRILADLGGDFEDIHAGLTLWEHAVEPESEQGSEGYYAPITDTLMALLAERLDQMVPIRLTARWARMRPDRQWDAIVNLPSFYDQALDASRARSARDKCEPWLAKMNAKREAKLLGETIAPARSKGPAPSL